jgi:hypothetical protein
MTTQQPPRGGARGAPPARRKLKVAGEAFDPAKYITRVGGADYLEVKWRLVWLREDHKDAEIVTELRSPDPDNLAIFRAEVRIPGGGSATGWGSCKAGSFGDFLEKAETKAIGRALAALGYGTQFCEDHDMGGMLVDSPVEPPRAASGPERPAPARQGQEAPAAPQRGTRAATKAPEPQPGEDGLYLAAPAGVQRTQWEADVAAAVAVGPNPAEAKQAWARLLSSAKRACAITHQPGRHPVQGWRFVALVDNAPTAAYLGAIEAAIEENGAWTDDLTAAVADRKGALVALTSAPDPS